MTLFDKINEGIKTAMKAKDKARLEALRNIKKVMIEVKSSKGAGSNLTDDESLKIIAKLAKQGQDSADIYKQQGREDLYEQEISQVEVYKSFLPEMLSGEELAAAVRNCIIKAGAVSMKDMGKVMKVASKELAGKADGKDIANEVKRQLQ